MELAILAGMGLLGYRLAARGVSGPRDAGLAENPRLLRRKDVHPVEHDADVDLLLARDSRDAGYHVTQAQAQIDQLRGNATQPFVTNDARQAFNETFAQRRMESYTGTDDTIFRKKSERGSFFAPAERQTVPLGSGGVPRMEFDTDAERMALTDRGAFGSRYNNVGPTDRQLVGPGLGVGADVAATGGLHSTWRQLPVEDLNAHRINQLPGRANHGAKPTTDRLTDAPTMATTKVDLSGVAKPLGAGRAAGVQGHLQPPGVRLPKVKRAEGTDPYYGPSHVTSAGVSAYPQGSALRRKNLGTLPTDAARGSTVRGHLVYEGANVKPSDRVNDNPYIGTAFSKAGTYVELQDCLRDTDRDELNPYVGQAFYGGTYVPHANAPRQTDREWATGDHHGGAYAVVKAGIAATDIVLRDTTRETQGGPRHASVRATGMARTMDAPGTTLRDLSGSQAPVLTGSRPGAGFMRRKAGYRRSQKVHAINHIPIGSMSSVSRMQQRVDLRGACLEDLPVPVGSFVSASRPRRNPTAIPRNKLPSANPRAPPPPARTCE